MYIHDPYNPCGTCMRTYSTVNCEGIFTEIGVEILAFFIHSSILFQPCDLHKHPYLILIEVVSGYFVQLFSSNLWNIHLCFMKSSVLQNNMFWTWFLPLKSVTVNPALMNCLISIPAILEIRGFLLYGIQEKTIKRMPHNIGDFI